MGEDSLIKAWKLVAGIGNKKPWFSIPDSAEEDLSESHGTKVMDLQPVPSSLLWGPGGGMSTNHGGWSPAMWQRAGPWRAQQAV